MKRAAMKNQRSKMFATVVLILIAVWFGSWLQVRVQGYNAHAHLSDVGDAKTLGSHFATLDQLSGEQVIAAKATRAIIRRILSSSEPGPNSKARLETLEAELIALTATNE